MIHDSLNIPVLKFILEEALPATRILDVGCGTGTLGRILKSKINCYITGIELDKETADAAREVYDEVIEMDLENLINKSCEFKNRKKYNFIIFSDILEHLTRPERLLACFDEFLEGDGFLIASIPNIANWMVRIRLLMGNFDYSRGGILSQGHLRFFTYKNARRLLENSGYRIISVVNNNATWPMRLLGKFWKRMFAFQFVFKCVKNKEDK